MPVSTTRLALDGTTPPREIATPAPSNTSNNLPRSHRAHAVPTPLQERPVPRVQHRGTHPVGPPEAPSTPAQA
ncbi:hypothetical protein DHEL01_v205270 [Diaporthe helianthi]|uniref:Uncharacterized protein n=1 Tax=Diaporthe helianthi TaxID=158607 RepID=A0A2P5I1E0_DIAHE|nr:hypothetical protein DHEL01_v205270 [Diaporthe helianthi]